MNKVSFRNTDICYTKQGNGPAIVLLHGYCESHLIWKNFIEQLSMHYTVIAPDLPGHGESECVGNEHSMEIMAEAIFHLLHQNEIEKCVVIGHSMGGYVALAIAEQYPELIAGLGLFHSTAYADTPEKKEERTRTIQVVNSDKFSYVTKFVDNLFAEDSLHKIPEKINQIKDLYKKTPAEGITAALAGMRDRKDRTEVLRQIRKPILFISGKKDKVLPPEKMAPLFLIPALANILILDNTGHMGFIEAERETLFSVDKFVEFCYSK